ncbi:MAG: FAD-dependent oxidoreductase [Raoultibacter sp.]
MADFDAIVVGSGCAGAVAAYELAQANKSVLVIERGNFAGAKNMTGGRIYSHSLKKVFPDFESSAPLERKIARERISLIAEDANFTLDFTSDEMRKESQDSYAVLRGSFDQWLAEQAERAGAEYIYGIAVEGLMKDATGKVCGVRAGEDEITAEVVLLCDGVNSLLTKDAVNAQRPHPGAIAVGIKQTIELDAQTITDRVLAASDAEGAAWLFSGYATQGTFGGGFMYTNRNSVSLGIVAGIEATMNNAKVPLCQMLEDLKMHPEVAALIRGGKVVEHSGHMVPEGGINIMPELTGDGVLLAGESAMMCVNLGYQVRGMDYAIAAGQAAGIEAAKALDAGDTTKLGLSGYVRALENSFVLKDLKQFKRVPSFMEGFGRMFKGYPEMTRDMMNKMFIVDGTPVQPMKKQMMPIVKRVGILNLLKDAKGAMKAL